MFKPIAQRLLIFTAGFSVLAANAYAVRMEDPLRPPEYRKSSAVAGAKQQTVTDWYVNEILISGERRVAIINNKAVAKGERVNGAKVVDITPAHVVLEYKDKIINAQLGMVDIKKRVRTRAD